MSEALLLLIHEMFSCNKFEIFLHKFVNLIYKLVKAAASIEDNAIVNGLVHRNSSNSRARCPPTALVII